jgi:hypothetical protein
VRNLLQTSGLPDFRTSGLPERLPDFRTSGLPDFESFPLIQAQCQNFRQARLADLVGSGIDIVFDATNRDQFGFAVEDGEAGLVVFVARLTDRARVNDDRHFFFDRDFLVEGVGDGVRIEEPDRHMTMAKEAELGSEVAQGGKALLGIENGLDVIEGFWLMEGTVRHGEVVVGQGQRQIGQKFLMLFVELISRPDRRRFGVGVEAIDGQFADGGPVMVASNHITAQAHDAFEARDRFCTVTNDITQTDDFVDLLAINSGEDDFEGFRVAVDVAEERVTHEVVSDTWLRNVLAGEHSQTE